jgi:hypothetical protein
MNILMSRQENHLINYHNNINLSMYIAMLPGYFLFVIKMDYRDPKSISQIARISLNLLHLSRKHQNY